MKAWTTRRDSGILAFTAKNGVVKDTELFLFGRYDRSMSKVTPSPPKHSPRRGRIVEVAQHHPSAPASVRKARESSLSVHGAQIFNLLPRDLRDTNTGSVDHFKARLDDWLQSIPDQPTIPGRQRAAASNSLIDQINCC